MEPVIVIVRYHVFGTFNDKMRVVTEPDDVHDNGIIKIDNAPQQETGQKSILKGRTAVDMFHYQTENYDKQQGSCGFDSQ